MAGGLAVAIYLLVPIVLMTLRSVRMVIWLPIHETEWADQPRWKRPVFTAIIFVAAMVGWPLFVRAWFSSRERIHAAIVDRQRWRNDRDYRRNEILPEGNLTLSQDESAVDRGSLIFKTGLVSDLGWYAEMGELFLTTPITGIDADRIKEEMRPRSRLVTVTHTSDFEPPEKLDPPVYFEPLPTDEVWDYTTSTSSWQNLAGRAGHALVRDGVVICETTTLLS